jgi:hypothetical protein
MSLLNNNIKIGLFSCLFFLSSCGGSSCYFEFSDFSNNPMFECTPVDGRGTYSYGLRIKGEVSHPVELLIYGEKEKVKPLGSRRWTFEGKIDTLVSRDWGDLKLVGVIEATPNTKGHLKIKCSF